ncbi:AzlC family ABC transporter permease [Rhodoblastus acidophilus]|uniref:AzlC family ABC transporter permease n=1 Tax=Candidatus Rhodoblastus alkanivorans TaxID=2954117 RepID=A0ABS9Z855_9HYPH|nr:AzlC family ABC transporter permease [Candidatus Rhodoblastus alkanivorans]MCI4677912.1 AzlC family ABC transporter permease [Candidatus Rhodoblastus alkanivorans]MCI4683808.1 AzlC family ABC transporter permease [Candidatus Rhodoblastus alkanivorans]MDI4641126.1 AzlC family ABC transporter permease [Rhodoblastus acidophilus]
MPAARGAFFAGVRLALSGPAFYVALSLMGVGSLARAAGFPVGAAALSTILLWAGPAQLLFFGAAAAKTAPPAIALAVSLSSVRLLPMCLSVLPMLREKKTRLPTMFAAAHFVAVTVWAESLRRLPDMERPARKPFFFGLALTCMGLTAFSTALGFWLMGSLPKPLGAGLMMLSPIYFLATTARAARSGADWLAILFGALLAPLTMAYVGGGFDLLVLALVGGGAAWFAGFKARRAA